MLQRHRDQSAAERSEEADDERRCRLRQDRNSRTRLDLGVVDKLRRFARTSLRMSSAVTARSSVPAKNPEVVRRSRSEPYSTSITLRFIASISPSRGTA